MLGVQPKAGFTVTALIAALYLTSAQTLAATTSTGPFNKVWTVALSLNQASETGNSLTQLADGTVVVGGGDSNQPNYCSTRRNPTYGGAWFVAVTPGSGTKVWQTLYSTCASSAQSTSAVRQTADGGLVLAGGDFDNPACGGGGCGWFAKLTGNGSIAWQHDLAGAYSAGATTIQPTRDGGYIAVGNESANSAEILHGLIMKISSTGALLWSTTFGETDQSFPGAYAGANFTFESVQQTADGGFITSGVADAKFASGYASVLVLTKLDATGNTQWARVYYGSQWFTGAAGDSNYPVFQTPDGRYVLSGTVQGASYPYQRLFFLVKLDALGNIIWQKGYGGSNNGYDVSTEGGGAAPTSDGGYVLAGQRNVFLQAGTGWIVKTDASGDVMWQKTYTGLTTSGGNRFNGIIQTADGGYAAAGDSWTSSPTYGGPGLWLVKMDANGNVRTCSCAQNTAATTLALDLGVYPGSFVASASNLAFVGNGIKAKSTSVTPSTIFP